MRYGSEVSRRSLVYRGAAERKLASGDADGTGRGKSEGREVFDR